MAKRHRRLGEILVEWGVITASAVEEGLTHAKREGVRIGEALVALGSADEEDVTKALASQFDMEYVDLERNVVAAGVSSEIPDEVIRRHMVLPISREGNKLKVIITDPLDLETLDMLRFRLNAEIECVLASRTRLKAFIERFHRRGGDVSIDEVIHQASIDQSMDQSIDRAALASGETLDPDSAPVIRLVTMLIHEAVKTRASDIHIEPMANRIRVRYRIDGVCRERDNIPKRMQGPVINRVKIMSGIDLAEKRIPTDGRIRLSVGGSDVDFRVSCLPAYHGESVVLRILRPDSARLGVQNLGFDGEDLGRFNKIIRRPNGIFLVTGPTGSGKTTTLYAALNDLNRPDRKIITAEDPVEYNFTGINQVQVNEVIELTFAKILRSMLRQAPNIILVGEIRDHEVAKVAIEAALTGHLVFSTLHTNDAPSAITRLIDMGLKPFLVASSIQAVLAQRLVRLICADCREQVNDVDPKLLRALGFSQEEMKNGTFYRGKGCKVCGGTGYRGRKGIFELMEMNHVIADLAIARGALSDIRKAAKASGMKSLLEDGRRKVMAGITTAEELINHTQATDLVND